MTQALEAVTTAALSLALDAASMRQRAIAANIANHAVEGYAPLKVDFEAQLDEARRSLETGGSAKPADLASVQPRMQPALDAQGLPVKVRLDAEVASMAENAVHYQVLARALSKHLAILSTAVHDGKR